MTENTSVVSPLWFDIERLKEVSYNAEEYVTELRRYVPLDAISTQLETYLTQLKHQLVEVINEKYNDFIGLSGKLTGVEGAITRIRKPLTELMLKLQVVERGLESELELLSLNLNHRQKLVNAHRQLEMMQNAIQTGTKIEKLIIEIESSMDSDFVIKSSLLERVSQEIGKLDLLLAEEKELELIQRLLQQNAEFKEKVKRQLQSSLQRTLELQNPDHGPILRILHGFSIIGASTEGEMIIKKFLVEPLYLSLQQEKDLRKFFQTFVSQVFQSHHGLLLILMKSPPGLENYCFLGNCLMKSLHEEIKKHRSFVYSAGNPDSFLQNYKSVLFLLEQLESYCPTRPALDDFRLNPAVKDFLKEWNLSVYFAMRFQEIAGLSLSLYDVFNSGCLGLLDEAIMTEKTQNRTAESLNAISVWMQSMDLCFAPHIFINQLTDQFIKLFLKLLSRFEHWLKIIITAESPKTNEDFAFLEKELEKPMEHLRTGFYLKGLGEESKRLMEKTIDEFLNRLESIKQQIIQLVADRLVVDCAALVKKSVGTAVSTMFIPTSDRPTQPNDYIKRLLDPLRLFLESPLARQDVKSKIKISVIKGVCVAYRQALVDVLSLWEKSRMSLRRINKNRLTPATEGETSSSTELGNVYQQHWLDVSAFGQVLTDLELPPLTEYTELKDLIISKKEEI